MTAALAPVAAGGGSPPPVAACAGGADGRTVEVLALTECIIGGVRRYPREWFDVPAERVPLLVQCGLVLSQPMLAMMTPAAREAWAGVAGEMRRTNRVALAPDSLVVDAPTLRRLWGSTGRILTPEGVASHYAPADFDDFAVRVLQVTEYDPGSSVYRYHSAANTAPGVVSALVRYDYTNPHCHLRQWDGDAHRVTVEALAATADVIHCHMDYRGLFQRMRTTVEPHQRAAITYHGSLPPGDPRRTFVDEDTDRRLGAVRFGARPYHHRWGVEHWLPIPMPVRDYLALRAERRVPPDARPFRIAHSPTKRDIKGTAEFLRAVEYVRDQMGLPVEAVLIEDMPHGEGLAAKAACDAVFDSFWLGMQGSGLESAAMALPVIAGDPGAVADLQQLGIGCPWTFANSEDALRHVIARLAQEPDYAASEAARVHAYAVQHHDYPVVGAKYATILTEAIHGAADDR